ncbi:oxidoreductase isoform X1 [Brachionus plicatilis]|uniref:Oxidoreductase isoform X1 n=1 Tax=Brachionus plicatilis TaxID=10195 RepID=A0A3M7RCU9_BRAPC|nr:oxidoreductase isoform X1 [Brachionus plicatilis]
MKFVSILVVGCGNRGEVYGSYALKHPDRARVVAIAEPRVHLRRKVKEIHKLTNDKYIFSDWRDVIELDERVADCAIIALQDKFHKEATINFIKKGYHILLEKPMATLLEDCFQLTSAIRSHPSQINAVCHVLRYLAPCTKMKQLIDSGFIGNVVNISHTEPVGFYHFAHSFVRGNWNNESKSSFSLLAKCCHDIDLIMYWMEGKKCTQVQSFGSLNHFKKSNAPENSADLCMKCPVESECCYSAKKIYLTSDPSRWPAKVVLNSEIQNIFDNESDMEDLFVNKSLAEKVELLKKCLSHDSTQYGRCVYKMADNDVCDNQTVNLQFDDGSAATMTMIAFTKDICTRKTKIYGTKGMLEWDDATLYNKVIYTNFLNNTSEIIDCQNERHFDAINENENIKLDGHGGSDYYLMDSFIEACIKNDKSLVLTDFEDSFKSHLIVFAAEYSRRHNQIINIDDFCKNNGINMV